MLVYGVTRPYMLQSIDNSSCRCVLPMAGLASTWIHSWTRGWSRPRAENAWQAIQPPWPYQHGPGKTGGETGTKKPTTVTSKIIVIVYVSPIARPTSGLWPALTMSPKAVKWLSFFSKRHDATDGACTQEAKYVPTHVGCLFFKLWFERHVCHTSCALSLLLPRFSSPKYSHPATRTTPSPTNRPRE